MSCLPGNKKTIYDIMSICDTKHVASNKGRFGAANVFFLVVKIRQVR